MILAPSASAVSAAARGFDDEYIAVIQLHSGSTGKHFLRAVPAIDSIQPGLAALTTFEPERCDASVVGQDGRFN